MINNEIQSIREWNERRAKRELSRLIAVYVMIATAGIYIAKSGFFGLFNN